VGLPPVTCPATREAAAGQSCPTQDAYCTYADLVCDCTNCFNGPASGCAGSPTWHCDVPNADAACPAGISRLGSALHHGGQNMPVRLRARRRAPLQAGGLVQRKRRPVSRVEPAGQEEHSLLERGPSGSAWPRIWRGSSWPPTNTGILRWANRRYLGFIIEDVPGSPAVDRDGTMVDLYGYTSMLVAAVQAQSEALAKLRTELAQVKRRLRVK